MTIQEIRDSFMMKYTYEADRRGEEKPKSFTEAMIASWIAEGEMEVVRTLGFFTSSQSITLVTGTTSYALNTNFGRPLRLFDGSNEYELISYEDFNQIVSGDSNYYFAIEYKETSNVHINPSPTSSSVDPTLTYKVDTNYYSPGGDTDWKTTTTSTFSGESILPKRYTDVIIRYCMWQAFPEDMNLERRYKEGLRSVRQSQPFTKKINYRMNGGIV